MNEHWMGSLLDSGMVDRVGWTLLHSVWEGFLVALVVGVLLRAMRGASSGVRYGVASLGLACMVMVVAGTFFVVAPQAEGSSRAGAAPVVRSAEGTPEAERAQGRREDGATGGERGVQGGVVGTVMGAPLPVRVEEVSAPAQVWGWMGWLEAVFPWVVGAWVLGVLGLSVWHVGGWVAMQRLRRVGVSAVEERLVQMLERLRRRMGIKWAVGIGKSVMVGVPVVIGHFRPMVLVPGSVLTGLSVGQLEAILAHELAHIRRHDYVVNLLQTVVETLLFYHPGAWWLSRRIREERECCCDDLASAVCGDRVVYAEALLSVEELRGTGGAAGLALAASGGGVMLGRVRRLLEGKAQEVKGGRNRSLAGVGMVALLIGVAVMTPGVAFRGASAKASDEAAAKYPPVGHVDPNDAGSPATRPGSATCELSGRVVDAQGKGVPGAKVYFCNNFLKPHYVAEKDVTWPQNSMNISTVEADGEGKFRFNYMYAGRTDVWAETATAAGIARNLASDAKDVTIQLAVKNDTITVDGRLFDVDGKTPMAGVRMVLLNGENEPKLLAEAKTDEAGHYGFEIKQVYSYSPRLFLVARPEGQSMAWATLPICSVSGFDIQLKAAAQITGRVTSKAGEAVAGAKVRVLRTTDPQYGDFFDGDNTVNPEVATDGEGRFTLAAIPQGANVSFRVFHPDYEIVHKQIEAPEAEQEVGDIRLSAGAVIEGTVYLGSKDKPAEGATVTLGYPMDPARTVVSDKNGHYQVKGVSDFPGSPSQQLIEAAWGGTPPQWEGSAYHEQARKTGDDITIDLVLRPSLAVRGAAWKAVAGTSASSNCALAVMSDDDPALIGKSQYDDTLKVLGDGGKVLWQHLHLSICQTSGGAHALVADPKRSCLWVTENVGKRLLKFNADGKVAWEKPDVRAESLAIDPATGNAWVLTSEGTIYGKSLVVFSPDGEQLKEIKTSGYDIAYSVHDDCFWIVGKSLQKVDREGNVTAYSHEFPWVATCVSVDEKDGSVWVAEGRHPNVIESRGQVWVFETDGSVRKTFTTFGNVCTLVVDSERGVVWISGTDGVVKVDRDGKTLAEAPIGMSSSCTLEPDTGYAWFATYKGGLYRVDKDAHLVWSDTSSDVQKFIAVWPE